MGLRSGNAGVAITAGVVGIIAVLISTFEIADEVLSVGTGLWLVTFASIAATGLGFAGLGVRVPS